jgi:hypothetical protein
MIKRIIQLTEISQKNSDVADTGLWSSKVNHTTMQRFSKSIMEDFVNYLHINKNITIDVSNVQDFMEYLSKEQYEPME